MASPDAGARRRNPSSIFSSFALLLFISTIFFFSSLNPSSPNIHPSTARSNAANRSCNYTAGDWIQSQNPFIPRYDGTCKEIFKGWNCVSGGKPNARDLLHWRWKPSGCDLLPLDPFHFLRRFRGKSIGK